MWFDYPVHNFNSHAHVERDVRVTVGKEIIDNFNSHAHVERDGHAYADFRRCEHFNSHAHVERDLLFYRHTVAFNKFQLTRSRGA